MNKKEYLLLKLAEEASEVVQAVTKIKVFGYDSVDPRDAIPETNFVKLLKEIGDMAAIIELLDEQCDFGELSNQTGLSESYIDDKKIKVMNYYDKLFGENLD